ncbi:MAG: hemerythrin domain-containing protein [bacterium]
MRATDILFEEHRIIMKVLECLQRIVEEAEGNGRLNGESADTALDFFRNFADGCHHAKEEDRLFVVLEEQGIPREGGPIGVMLMEHDHGRRYVRGMADSAEKATQGEPQAIQSFAENARDFMVLLRNHIDKEDQVLFPMAVETLRDQAKQALFFDFKRIEAEAGGKRHSHYLEVARKLCEQYGVDFVDENQIQTLLHEF